MVAKLIVHGDDRAEALARLDAALAQTHIVGLNTNLQFLRYVVRSESFGKARLDTGLIQREHAVVFKQEPVGLALAVALAVAQTLQEERALDPAGPFGRRDGWRAFGVAVRRFGFEFAGEPVQAQLTYGHDGGLRLDVAEHHGELQLHAVSSGLDVQFAGVRSTAFAYRLGDWVHLFTPQGATRILAVDLLAHAGDQQAEGGRLTAPMPGKLLSFSVKSGDKVHRGQPLAVMEAMKMEHTIAAPADGLVAELLFAPGDQVGEGAELLTLVV